MASYNLGAHGVTRPTTLRRFVVPKPGALLWSSPHVGGYEAAATKELASQYFFENFFRESPSSAVEPLSIGF